jgi:hypothetical protein
MSFIKVIYEEDATGEVKAVYDKTLAGLRPSVRQRRGNKLPPIVRIFGLCPPLLEARVGFDKGIYRPGHSGLGRRKEERLAAAGSEALATESFSVSTARWRWRKSPR